MKSNNAISELLDFISSSKTSYPDEQPTPTSNLFRLAEGGVARRRDYCIHKGLTSRFYRAVKTVKSPKLRV